MLVRPYVYRLTHKDSKQFYIGYREANKLPAEQDLPNYQSSSEVIKSLGFENFNYEIIAELSTGEEAYDLENILIKESFNDPLCLNGQFVDDGKLRFRRVGPHSPETVNRMRGPRSDEFKQKMKDVCGTEEYRQKMSDIKKNQVFTEERKRNISEALKGRKLSEEHKRKMGAAHKGKTISEDHKRKISEANKNRKRKNNVATSRNTQESI